MDFTLAICTHNRRAQLERTLDGLRDLVTAGVQFEVVVVDNASTDGTAEALAIRGGAGDVARVVPEPVVGLWRARNRAIAAARGNYLLFLDDDVTVAPELLSCYQQAILEHPTAPFLGGPIVPVFDSPPSELALVIAERQPGVYSALDLGPDVMSLAPTDGPWGANCCIRRSAIGTERFDGRFGYSGGQTISGDETEFLSRLTRVHGLGVWVPGARVEHRIAADRTTWEYLRRSARGSGRAKARLTALHGRRPWTLPQMLLTALPRYWRLRRQSRTMDQQAPIAERVGMEYALWRARGMADDAREMLMYP
ncbi:MAG: glycosyltransferase [Gemmatimonadales bacterium]